VLTLSWEMLQQQSPDLAAFGQARLDGKVAYLSTVRASGWPRTQPVTPIIGEGRCFFFADPDSLKVGDLLAQGKYCLHCAMSNNSGSSGEFQLTGVAEQIIDPVVREQAEAVSNFRPAARYVLFELKVNEALGTTYRGGLPERQRWLAEPAR
jgi:hypothetical protein